MAIDKNKFYTFGTLVGSSSGGGSIAGEVKVNIIKVNDLAINANKGNADNTTLRVVIADDDTNLSSIVSSSSSIDTKLTTTNVRLTSINTKLTTTNVRLTSIDTKLTTTNATLTNIETNTDPLVLAYNGANAFNVSQSTEKYTTAAVVTAVNGANIEILPSINLQEYRGFFIWIQNTGANPLTDVAVWGSPTGGVNTWVDLDSLQDSVIETACKTLASGAEGIAFMSFGPHGFKFIKVLASSGAATSTSVIITAQS
jgi:hypothetical protein